MNLLMPIYLIGLVAIAIPLWLHLMNRENPRIQDFASTMFLEPTQVSSSSIKKLRFRKLLSLRLALLLLLIFLFAEPIINRLSQWISAENTLHVLMIDRSFSMRHSNRWILAIEKSRELLTGLPDGDNALILTADQRLTQIGEQSTDRTSLADLLSKLQPGYGRLRYDVMIAKLQSLIDEATLPVKVYLFTDAQSSGLSTRIRDLVPRGASELQVVTVGSEADKNAFIRSATYFQRQDQGQVSVFLAGIDQYSEPDTNVSLLLENNSELSSKIEKTASGDFVASFTGLALQSGINRFTASLSLNDALAEDNQYFIAIDSGQHYPIGFVGDSSSTAELFLRTALLADDRLVANTHGENSPGISDETALIVVPDLSVLTESEQGEINEFVHNGGKALIVSGALPLQSTLHDSAVAQTNMEATIGFVDTSHPVIADTDSWRSVHIFRPEKIQLLANDRVLVALSDGSPFIIERTIGKGRQVVIASSLDGTRNDLPTSPVFVPFVLRTVRELTGMDSRAGELTAGSSLVIESGGQLFSPSGEDLIKLSALGTANQIELNQPGVYELRSKGRNGSVAVNTDPLESSMPRLDAEFLAAWQSLASDKSNRIPEEKSQLRSQSQNLQLWYWLLPALLVLVILEALYANKLLNIQRGTAP